MLAAAGDKNERFRTIATLHLDFDLLPGRRQFPVQFLELCFHERQHRVDVAGVGRGLFLTSFAAGCFDNRSLQLGLPAFDLFFQIGQLSQELAQGQAIGGSRSRRHRLLLPDDQLEMGNLPVQVGKGGVAEQRAVVTFIHVPTGSQSVGGRRPVAAAPGRGMLFGRGGRVLVGFALALLEHFDPEVMIPNLVQQRVAAGDQRFQPHGQQLFAIIAVSELLAPSCLANSW